MLRSFASLALLVLAASATGCQDGYGIDNDYYVGGKLGGDERALLIESEMGLCSGMLVTPRCVVTAAHCVTPGPTKPGETARPTRANGRVYSKHIPPTLYSANNVRVHSSYPDPGFSYVPMDRSDVAVIGLNTAVTTLPSGTPRVSIASAPPSLGQRVKVNGRTLDGVVQNEVVSTEIIVTSTNSHYVMSDNAVPGIPTGGSDRVGHISQGGDSGGPMFIQSGTGQPTLFAVLGGGYGGYGTGEAGRSVYSRLDRPDVRNWIQSTCDSFAQAGDTGTFDCSQYDNQPSQCTGPCAYFACNNTCKTKGSENVCPTCGDGIVQASTGEACDEGSKNSDTTPNACRTDCRMPKCGDAVVDTGEECDDGAGNSSTKAGACRLDCTAPECGDGIVDPGEQCDNGAQNSDTAPNACRTSCETASCGDGVIDSGETCDAAEQNSDTVPDACRTTCAAAGCGDSVVDMGETCDEGGANSDTAVDACRTSCQPAHCGDGVLDTAETCDSGAQNSDTVADACRTTCSLATCGDGVVDMGEDCDDGEGNGDHPGACRATCVLPHCGDGVVDFDEECDDGPTGTAMCTPACELDDGDDVGPTKPDGFDPNDPDQQKVTAGCSTSSSGGSPLLVMVMAVLLLRRRRRR